jgi:hypothetical protein
MTKVHCLLCAESPFGDCGAHPPSGSDLEKMRALLDAWGVPYDTQRSEFPNGGAWNELTVWSADHNHPKVENTVNFRFDEHGAFLVITGLER